MGEGVKEEESNRRFLVNSFLAVCDLNIIISSLQVMMLSWWFNNVSLIKQVMAGILFHVGLLQHNLLFEDVFSVNKRL